jgi:hypothetical protein
LVKVGLFGLEVGIEDRLGDEEGCQMDNDKYSKILGGRMRAHELQIHASLVRSIKDSFLG